MTYLLLHISIWLFLAALVGALIGWLLRKVSTDEQQEELSAKLSALGRELVAVRAALGATQQERDTAQKLREKAEASLASSELAGGSSGDAAAAAEKRAQALEVELSACRERVHVLEVEAESKDRFTPQPFKSSSLSAAISRSERLEAQLGECRVRRAEIDEERESLRLELAELRRQMDLPKVAAEEQLQLKLGADGESAELRLERLQKEHQEVLAQLTELIVRNGEAIAPEWLLDAPTGQADDLKRIKGIGPVLEGLLNSLGIFHFHQLSKLDAPAAAWLSGQLNTFPGRIFRDRWVEQARTFAAER